MTISAVVVSHGHAAELEVSLAALATQVDEIVVVANVPGSVRALPDGVRVIENARPRCLAANVNAGIAATVGSLVLFANPDAVPAGDAVGELASFMESHPRCGIAGPQMLWPDGTWQPSRRRFPTVAGTIVRRTPLRRRYPPYERQRDHYLLDERPTEPVEADWMLGAFLLQRRTMLEEIGGLGRRLSALRRGHRPLLPGDASGLGAVVRAVGGRHARIRRRDRSTLPLAPHAVAPPGNGTLRAEASGGAGRSRLIRRAARTRCRAERRSSVVRTASDPGRPAGTAALSMTFDVERPTRASGSRTCAPRSCPRSSRDVRSTLPMHAVLLLLPAPSSRPPSRRGPERMARRTPSGDSVTKTVPGFAGRIEAVVVGNHGVRRLVAPDPAVVEDAADRLLQPERLIDPHEPAGSPLGYGRPHDRETAVDDGVRVAGVAPRAPPSVATRSGVRTGPRPGSGAVEAPDPADAPVPELHRPDRRSGRRSSDRCRRRAPRRLRRRPSRAVSAGPSKNRLEKSFEYFAATVRARIVHPIDSTVAPTTIHVATRRLPAQERRREADEDREREERVEELVDPVEVEVVVLLDTREDRETRCIALEADQAERHGADRPGGKGGGDREGPGADRTGRGEECEARRAGAVRGRRGSARRFAARTWPPGMSP